MTIKETIQDKQTVIKFIKLLDKSDEVKNWSTTYDKHNTWTFTVELKG